MTNGKNVGVLYVSKITLMDMVWQLDMVNSKTDRIAVERFIMIDVSESPVISLHFLVYDEI